jgi:hypothetical protein
MKMAAGILIITMTAGLGTLSGAQAQSGQLHQVCIGEFESTCKRYPITDFY